jgi:hypothetical protein
MAQGFQYNLDSVEYVRFGSLAAIHTNTGRMSACGRKADILFLRVPGNRRRVKHGTVNANAFHSLSLGRVHQDRAPGTTTNSASHEFFEGDLARQIVTSGKFSNGSQHYCRAAAEYRHATAVLIVQVIEPLIGQVGDVSVKASVIALQAR